MNDDGNQLTIPKATDAQSASKLVDRAFLRFDVTIHPSTAYSECTESSFTLKSAVGIPDIIRDNALTPPLLDVRQLLDAKTLLSTIQGVTGSTPVVGTIKASEAGSKWMECMPDVWTKRVHEYYLRCVFAILAKRIQETFVGELADTTVQQDLTSCKQTVFDQTRRQLVNQTVTEYYEAFTMIITGSPYDDDQPFPFDIGDLFFGGANENLRLVVQNKRPCLMLPCTSLLVQGETQLLG